MITKNSLLHTIFFLSFFAFSSLHAETQNSNFQTQAQLQASCSISMPNYNFGNISYKFDKVVMNTLTVVCNKGIVATVSISTGTSGTFSRHMTTGNQDSDILKYSLYLPGGQAQLGDGTNGTVTFQINGTGEPVNQFISGIISRNQYIRPGNYSDNLTMILTY